MTVYVAFGSASVGKELFQRLFKHAKQMDLIGHSRDGDEAIAEIARHKPDLVIVEEILKYGWGMDVVETIESRDGIPVVIMVSTTSVPHPAEIFRSQGIDLWFQLPEDGEKLDATLIQLAAGDDSLAAISAWRKKMSRGVKHE